MIPLLSTGVCTFKGAARRDLLRVLTYSSEVRAGVIRQFHERGSEDMADLLKLRGGEGIAMRAGESLFPG
jgi:hypothetical protein